MIMSSDDLQTKFNKMVLLGGICSILLFCFVPVCAQEIYHLILPSSDGFLVEMTPNMLAQAYLYGKENQYTDIERLLPEYFVEFDNSWALISTQWAEAVLSGWNPQMPQTIPLEEVEFLQALSYKLIVRTPIGTSIELWHKESQLEPISQTNTPGMNFYLFDYSQINSTEPLTLVGYSDDPMKQWTSSIQWDWTTLGEGRKINILYREGPLLFSGWDETKGAATFYLGGYPLTINLQKAWVEMEDEKQAVIYIPGSYITNEGVQEFFLLPMVEGSQPENEFEPDDESVDESIPDSLGVDVESTENGSTQDSSSGWIQDTAIQ